MRLKQYLKDLGKCVLLLNLVSIGCIANYQPTYKKENLVETIQEICNKEYGLLVKAKLVGSTLGIYLPLENFLEVPQKPKKYIERFKIETNEGIYHNQIFHLTYLIRPINPQEKVQKIKITDSALKKIRNVLRVLQRTSFSIEKLRKKELEFFYLAVADIKYGILFEEIFYIEDLKKLYYGIISTEEYQHRVIQEINQRFDLIEDWEGKNIQFRPIEWADFILLQIKHRIRLKFESSEIKKENIDIDKEILKIISTTLNIYKFHDFSEVTLHNLFTEKKIVLNQEAILNKTKMER